jgi:hypothetical protein
VNNVGQDELLHTAAGSFYSFDIEEAGRGTAADTGRRTERVAQDRIAIRDFDASYLFVLVQFQPRIV